MSGTTKLILYILLTVVVGWVAVKLVSALLGMLMGILVPVVVIGGVVLLISFIVNRKALGGGRRTLP